MLNESPFVKLLGIHCGQFPEELKLADGAIVTGHSGMTIALPSDNIHKLLNQARSFAERLAAVDAQWKGANFPCPE